MNTYKVFDRNFDLHTIVADSMAPFDSGAVVFQMGMEVIAVFYEPVSAVKQ